MADSLAAFVGFLLNFAGVQTTVEVLQVSVLLFLSTSVPLIASEILWGNQPIGLLKVKILNGLSSTVAMAHLMHWINSKL
ncbi:hypothetical protein BGZ76_003888 [Entomortierella beljakovae]|nr:hypothetical protein BGZ76_003888 [Entomortierella beljakovae]